MLIDVDELGRTDNEKWVWGGANVIEPDLTRAMVGLSPGGSDAPSGVNSTYRKANSSSVDSSWQRPSRKWLGRSGHPAGGHRLR